jgi:HSP20 family protein
MIFEQRTCPHPVSINRYITTRKEHHMFVSTTFPTFPFRVRALPVRYGVRTPYARSSFVRSTSPAVSGRWADGAYELTADLPGVPEDAVAVSVAGRTLTLDVATDELTWSERIRLPQTLDPEHVAARYVNGRLTVTIAKAAEAAPRRIAVVTTSTRGELDAPEAAETESPSPSSNGQDVAAPQDTATGASVTE